MRAEFTTSPQVSARVALVRAEVTSRSQRKVPTTAYTADSSRQTAMSRHGEPPNAAPRMAAAPQVGGSTQEIGATQPGSEAMGTRNPQISHTGNSKAVPSAQAPR